MLPFLPWGSEFTPICLEEVWNPLNRRRRIIFFCRNSDEWEKKNFNLKINKRKALKLMTFSNFSPTEREKMKSLSHLNI